MYTINFKFEEKGIEPITIQNCEPEYSILEIALKNNIKIHHNCGGVCACSTCHIYIETNESAIEALSDKEEDFIDRAKNPRLNSRLGCQCVMLKGEGVIDVLVPDQSLIHGE